MLRIGNPKPMSSGLPARAALAARPENEQ